MSEAARIWNLINTVPFGQVMAALRELDEGADEESYRAAWDEMHRLAPKATTMVCSIRPWLDEHGRNDDGRFDVSGIENDTSYAIEFMEWADWLGMEVKRPAGMSDAEALAHILWEMTFCGYSQEEVREGKGVLDESIAEVKAMLGCEGKHDA